jgi:hypothetical protein
LGVKRVVLAVGLVAGCRSEDDGAPEPALPEFAEPRAQAEETGPELSPLDLRRDYLTQWSRCLLRTGSRLERSWGRLGQDVDVEKVRVRARDRKPFFDPVDGELLDACPLGADVPEGVPGAIATQGRAYVLAARGYGNRAKELRQYFDTEGYASDDWETLKDELPGLKEAYDAAHTAAGTFATSLEAAQDDADAAWLDELGRSGQAQSAAWHVTNTAMKGRATLVCVTRERPVPEACKTASEAFTLAHDGLEQWRDGHRADAVSVFWLDVFRKRADDLEAAIAGLQAPVSRRKKTAVIQLEAASVRVAEARAALLTAGNTVVFDFP